MPVETSNGKITIKECYQEVINLGKQFTELNTILKGMRESWEKRESTCPQNIAIRQLQDNVGYLKKGRESDKKTLEKFEMSLEKVETAVTGWKANLRLIGYVITSSGIFAYVFSRLIGS